ncbi:uncharacterized protein YndB with AHSA1/START domain [Luteibacter rhizovicinus]|uniref:Uncharacterized protein YndB with AHSA1/START domain n=1 Tax=Luteibacter rhizovicinus TaxID=242606 RepID=A0A4R3YPQ9_9GAMM|nr:SRPBCC domain-containing protein [Luteibacter rhizovicinus]TCV93154.1 uncharacterized protein YndB with AHSA1/START domain [Luteibacter rhizovicinus]
MQREAHNTMDMLEVEYQFRATPERVFDAWLDPKTAGEWLFATPKGEMLEVSIDPVKGGKWRIVERRRGEDILHTGEYTRIERPIILGFTFAVPQQDERSVHVSIEIEPTPGGCLLMLGHDVMPEDKERSIEGWLKILKALDRELRY